MAGNRPGSLGGFMGLLRFSLPGLFSSLKETCSSLLARISPFTPTSVISLHSNSSPWIQRALWFGVGYIVTWVAFGPLSTWFWRMGRERLASGEDGSVVLRRRGAVRRRRKERRPSGLVDLSLETLAVFVKSPNLRLQRSAIQLVVDKAMSDQFMSSLAKRCYLESPQENMKAVQVITLLCKFEYNKAVLQKHKIREALESLVIRFPSESVVKLALSNIYELLSAEDGSSIDLTTSDLIPKLIEILSSKEIVNQDVSYWALVLLHHLATSENFRLQLNNFEAALPAVINVTRESHGNMNMMKLGLNSMVKLVPILPGGVDHNLRILLNMDLLPIFGSCLRSDDTELVYLSLWLLHELSSKDICRNEIREMPAVVQGLISMLSSSDVTTHLAALRTLKILSHNYAPFQKTLIANQILKKVVALLSSESDDVRYWTIYLLHDLSFHAISHDEIFDCGGLDALVSCVSPNSHPLSHYIADIVGFLCNAGKNSKRIVESRIMHVITDYGLSPDYELQYWAIALMFNLAKGSDEFVRKVISDRHGLAFVETHIHKGDRVVIRVTAAKVAVVLAKKESSLVEWVETKIIQPLYSKFQHLFFETFGIGDEAMVTRWTLYKTPFYLSEHFGGMLESLDVFIASGLFQCKGILSESPKDVSNLPTILGRLITMVDTYSTFQAKLKRKSERSQERKASLPGPITQQDYLTSMTEATEMVIQKIEDELEELFENLSTEDTLEATGDQENECDVEDMTLNITSSTAQLISTLSQYDVERDTMLQLDILEVLAQLVFLFEGPDPPLAKDQRRRFTARKALIAFITLSQNIPIVEIKEDMLRVICTVWRVILNRKASSPFIFYGTSFLDLMWQVPSQDTTGISTKELTRRNLSSQPLYVKLQKEAATSRFLLSSDLLGARNEFWTLESCRANIGVTGTGKYYYEVVLMSEGFMKFGWANASCRFRPIEGHGVGDNEHSYAFEGSCARKSHHLTHESYGEVWSPGDTLSCLIDLDLGTISFRLNRQDFGVAFQGVDPNEIWYPAVSLGTSQECRFYFGSEDSPLFCPPGYRSLESALVIPRPARVPLEEYLPPATPPLEVDSSTFEAVLGIEEFWTSALDKWVTQQADDSLHPSLARHKNDGNLVGLDDFWTAVAKTGVGDDGAEKENGKEEEDQAPEPQLTRNGDDEGEEGGKGEEARETGNDGEQEQGGNEGEAREDAADTEIPDKTEEEGPLLFPPPSEPSLGSSPDRKGKAKFSVFLDEPEEAQENEQDLPLPREVLGGEESQEELKSSLSLLLESRAAAPQLWRRFKPMMVRDEVPFAKPAQPAQISPTLYFEIKVGSRTRNQSTKPEECGQFGLTDNLGNVWVLLLEGESGLFAAGIHTKQDGMRYLAICDEDKPASEPGISVRPMLDFGCGVSHTDHVIFFTKNGQPFGPVFTDIAPFALFPIALNLPRCSVNYGHLPFHYEKANEMQAGQVLQEHLKQLADSEFV